MCFPVFHHKEVIGISMGTIHIMIVDELVITAPEDEPFLVDRHGVGLIRYTFTIVLKDSIGLYCQHMYHVILAEVEIGRASCRERGESGEPDVGRTHRTRK